MHKTIVIVGAGPAGSMLAHKLSAANMKVLLFDHKAPWEKPCGGMLRHDTIEEHPELKRYPYTIEKYNGIVCLSTENNLKNILEHKEIPVIMRKELGIFLLDMAKNSGVKLLHEKVTDISKNNSKWIVETHDNTYKADLIIGADGANSVVRKKTIGKIPDKNMSLTCGYFLKEIQEKRILLKFLDINGFLWVIPRPKDVSIGILAMRGNISGRKLFLKLDNFIKKRYPKAKILKKWSALLPMIRDPGFIEVPCCGKSWLLIGDAAGHVDPFIGEGICYALQSAKLAAQSIIKENIPSYDFTWRKSYGTYLKNQAAIMKNITELAAQYDPEMIGALLYNYATKGSPL